MTAAVASVPALQTLLLDTHTLVWSMNESSSLGTRVKAAIRHAYREDRALISAITPWEIALLVSKGRLILGKDVLDWIREALAIAGVSLVSLEPEIAVASTRLPFEIRRATGGPDTWGGDGDGISA